MQSKTKLYELKESLENAWALTNDQIDYYQEEFLTKIETINVEEIGEVIIKVLANDWDAVIAITGSGGVGKSTLGVKVVKAVNKTKFKLKEQLLASPNIEEVKKAILKLDKGMAFLLDEAIEIVYSQDWYTEISKWLYKFYALNRKEQKCSIFVVPDFKDLNSKLRNNKVKLWIHIVARGYAIAFVRDRSPSSRDRWNLDKEYRLRGKYFKQNTKKIIRHLRRSRHYAFEFTFGDLDLNTRAEYEILRDRDKYKTLMAQDQLDGKKKRFNPADYIKVIKTLKKITVPAIQVFCNVKRSQAVQIKALWEEAYAEKQAKDKESSKS